MVGFAGGLGQKVVDGDVTCLCRIKKDENPTWILRRNLYRTTYRPIGVFQFGLLWFIGAKTNTCEQKISSQGGVVVTTRERTPARKTVDHKMFIIFQPTQNINPPPLV
jgi:hypothetical protein